MPLLVMLLRIDRMTFKPDRVNAFLEQFDESAPKIRAVEGCHQLELWQDPNVYTTFSHWTNEEALDQYRNSSLFRSIWAEVTPLFAARPRDSIDPADPNSPSIN